MDMKKQKRFTEVAILDICLPDFFTGYSYPVLSVPVYPGMKNKELSEAIKDEINCIYDCLVNESPDSYTANEIKLFDRFAEKIKDESEPLIDIPENECECDDDDCYCDSAYLFLGLCKPVRRYGMTFLNE